jgi:hypothetical protein
MNLVRANRTFSTMIVAGMLIFCHSGGAVARTLKFQIGAFYSGDTGQQLYNVVTKQPIGSRVTTSYLFDIVIVNNNDIIVSPRWSVGTGGSNVQYGVRVTLAGQVKCRSTPWVGNDQVTDQHNICASVRRIDPRSLQFQISDKYTENYIPTDHHEVKEYTLSGTITYDWAVIRGPGAEQLERIGQDAYGNCAVSYEKLSFSFNKWGGGNFGLWSFSDGQADESKSHCDLALEGAGGTPTTTLPIPVSPPPPAPPTVSSPN